MLSINQEDAAKKKCNVTNEKRERETCNPSKRDI